MQASCFSQKPPSQSAMQLRLQRIYKIESTGKKSAQQYWQVIWQRGKGQASFTVINENNEIIYKTGHYIVMSQ